MERTFAANRHISFADLLLAPARGLGALRITKSRKPPLEDEVLRLAEISPHLLHDIGFRQMAPGAAVWSDGRHRVAVPQADPADRLLRIGRF